MVVVLKLVDGFELSSNVELLSSVVEVTDSRVLLITSEDVESLLSPIEIYCQFPLWCPISRKSHLSGL